MPPHPPGHILLSDTAGDSGNKIFTVRGNGPILLAAAGERATEQLHHLYCQHIMVISVEDWQEVIKRIYV